MQRTIGASVRTRLQPVASALAALGRRPWLAYLAIVALQLKVMLWIWRYRDLTAGDTASYYTNGLRWANDLQVNIAWSPLYTAFLGSLASVLGDAFVVVVASRLIIAVAATVLVLALLRRIVPPVLAWCLSAWWALSPITFDTMYGVHLFSALFPLATFVLLARDPTPRGRGLALGLFVATTFLVRNEYVLATLMWGAIAIGFELFERRRGRGSPAGVLTTAYLLPVLVAALLVAFFYSRSVTQYPELSAGMSRKHTLNVCQIYAFNRIQQGDEWQGNPWTECQEIMERDFGVREPTFFQAIVINPRAIAGHLWWNFKLIPNGTQLALFTYRGARGNPDYAWSRRTHWIWIPTLVVAGVIVVGLRRIWLDREYWWRMSLARTWGAWAAMVCSSGVVLVVILMQRPRPSYMFTYTITIIAAFGLCADALARERRWRRPPRWLAPLGACILLAFAPPHYSSDYRNAHGYRGQALRLAYERIRPHVDASRDPDMSVVVTAQFYPLVCMYISTLRCEQRPYADAVEDGPQDLPVGPRLTQQGVDWLYLDPNLLAQPAAHATRAELLSTGWLEVNAGRGPDGDWSLLASPNIRPGLRTTE